MCKRTGWRYSPRLHIDLFGNKRAHETTVERVTQLVGAAGAVVALLQVWDYNRTKPVLPKAEPDGRFVKLENARLVEDAGNDGDSFKIADEDGVEHVLRLYFVDCAESGNMRR